MKRFDQRARAAPASGRKPLDWEDRRLPVHSGNAEKIVPDGAHDAGDVCAMPPVAAFGQCGIRVHWIAGFFHLVVTAGSRFASSNFDARVNPDVRAEIRVFVVGARVDLSDDNRAAASGSSPSL